MAFYWVNLGDSRKEVRDYNFLWAPTHTVNKSGSRTVNAGWGHVPKVAKGDIIFCHADGEIIYTAVAKKDAYNSPRPSSRIFDKWKKEGNKIEVDLEVLEPPIKTKEFKGEFISLYNNRCSPKLYTSKGEAGQLYMIAIPDAAGALLLNVLGDASESIQRKRSALENDEAEPRQTSQKSWSKSRLGQGKFRDDVLNLWGSACPVTGVSKPELLIASHIVSWQLANDKERLDGFNGFPFSPDIDKL
ncbi:MAG: HNH endonuclease, partial [Chloroflexi bacterium]|nr:HNH endonuclease [Chloroflexota bacterium]